MTSAPVLLPSHESVDALPGSNVLLLNILAHFPILHHVIHVFPVRPLRPALLQEYSVFHSQQLFLDRVRGRMHKLSGLAHSPHDIPQRLRRAHGICTRRLRSEHGRAMDHSGMHVARNHHRHATRRGDQVHENGILALRARHEDGRDGVAGGVHGFDNLARLQRDELHGGVVDQRETGDRGVAAEADDGASHAWIGDGRAVAKEVAVEEDVAAEVGDGGAWCSVCMSARWPLRYW